ncbi:MAG: hypothetical protein GX640_15340 [Fibrobacter sp.]|nr:hypothetical protein [Fibrobacter sp.]
MIKVLIADSDLDSHELVDDILQINFRDVKIDRALNATSFLNKIKDAQPPYNLILFNPEIDINGELKLLDQIRALNPQMLNHIILLNADVDQFRESESGIMFAIKKPFSLDYFSEVIKKACAS